MFDTSVIAQFEIFIQLFLAVVLGGLVGIERSLVHKTAGLRTFALVSLGSAAFTIVSQLAFANGQYVGFDPSRIASQIVVGIGFLAGGVIIFSNNRLQGLTTSAGIWVSAAIGLAVGVKLYALAAFVTILTLCIFGLFYAIEQRLVERMSKKVPHDPS